ncbi:MAG: hypothetical protein OXE73_02550 [Gammaproteobacteria bacterium]|nr:hypothetical protein [Gammaproteobacteria bacterium]
MRFVVAFLVLTLTPALPPQDASDRFRLFANCSPVRLGLVGVQDDTDDLGLSEQRVERAVRSRLRGARIYYSGPTAAEVSAMMGDDPFGAVAARRRLLQAPFLSVVVHVVERAFNLRIQMGQIVYNANADLDGLAVTWSSTTTGIHGRDPSFVLGSVSEMMDGFIDDYLRVNGEACRQP